MEFTVNDVKLAVQAHEAGLSMDNLTDPFNTLHRAALMMLREVDPPELITEQQLIPAVYDGIYMYSPDVRYKSTVDLYPTKGRSFGYEYQNDFRSTNQRNFNEMATREAPLLSEKFIEGERFLLINKYPTLPAISILTCESLTTGGTVSTSGDVNSASINTLNYTEGNGSISVNYTYATGIGLLKITGISTIDITDYMVNGAITFDIYFPTQSSISGLTPTLLFGNDVTSTYLYGTISPQAGTTFRVGWNKAKVQLSDMPQIGTVDLTAIDEIAVQFKYSTTNSHEGILIDNIQLVRGEMFTHVFNSWYMFTDAATGTDYQSKPTDPNNGDYVVLQPDTFDLYTLFCALRTAQETKNKEAYDMIKEELGYPYKNEHDLAGVLGQYKKTHPRKHIKPRTILRHYDV